MQLQKTSQRYETNKKQTLGKGKENLNEMEENNL